MFMLDGKMVRRTCIVLLSFVLEGCARPSIHEPVTLTLLEEWSDKRFSEARQQELQQFTRETGIRVSLLPSPDSARQRLSFVARATRDRRRQVLTFTALM